MSNQKFKDDIISETRAKRQSNGSYLGHCICHNDSNPSLMINFNDGFANPILFCFSGCSRDELVSELKDRDLWVFSSGGRHE